MDCKFKFFHFTECILVKGSSQVYHMINTPLCVIQNISIEISQSTAISKGEWELK